MEMLCPNSHQALKGLKHITALVNKSHEELPYAVHNALLHP